MKSSPRLITMSCLAAASIANAAVDLAAKTDPAVPQPNNAELQLLQGKWEGVMVGDQARQKIIITITGHSLQFFRDTNFWFDTTIAIPAGKNPMQLHATIKGCPPSQGESIGKIVRSFFKVENATLTLATLGDDAEETQKSFDAADTRYQLRRIQP